MRTQLNNVTLMCADTLNHWAAIHSLEHCQKYFQFADVLFFTNEKFYGNFKTVLINPLTSKEDYSSFMINELGRYDIKTSHIMVCEWDGFIINPKMWDDEFLKYDYLGGLWRWHRKDNVGNGGFSIRSTKLHRLLANDLVVNEPHAEDWRICRSDLKKLLVNEYGIKYAPQELARKFCFEYDTKIPELKLQKTFAIHGIETIIQALQNGC